MSLSVPFFGRTTGFEKSISDDDKDFIFVADGFSAMAVSFIKSSYCGVETQCGQTFFHREKLAVDFRFARAIGKV